MISDALSAHPPKTRMFDGKMSLSEFAAGRRLQTYKLVQADVSWYKLAQADISWYKLVQADLSWYKLVQPDISWYKLVQADII